MIWAPYLKSKLLTGWEKISDDPTEADNFHNITPGSEENANTYLLVTNIDDDFENTGATEFNGNMETWTNGTPAFWTYNTFDASAKETTIKKEGTYAYKGTDSSAAAERVLRSTHQLTAYQSKILLFTMWCRTDSAVTGNFAGINIEEVGNRVVAPFYTNFPADTWYEFYACMKMSASAGGSGTEERLWVNYQTPDAHQGNLYFDDGHIYMNQDTSSFPNESSGDFQVIANGIMLSKQTSVANCDANNDSYYLDATTHALYVNINGGDDPAGVNIYWVWHVRPQLVDTPTSLDLSGAASDIIVKHAERTMHIHKAVLLYTETSSVDAGVVVRLGKESDDDYYYTDDSEVSKAVWYTKDITADISDKVIASGDTLTFGTAGGKTGTGEVALYVELIPDLD
jgi:hypothetical protein